MRSYEQLRAWEEIVINCREDSGGKYDAVFVEGEGVGPRGSGVQTRVGTSPGAQACVTRGLESTPVRRLVEGP